MGVQWCDIYIYIYGHTHIYNNLERHANEKGNTCYYYVQSWKNNDTIKLKFGETFSLVYTTLKNEWYEYYQTSLSIENQIHYVAKFSTNHIVYIETVQDKKKELIKINVSFKNPRAQIIKFQSVEFTSQ